MLPVPGGATEQELRARLEVMSAQPARARTEPLFLPAPSQAVSASRATTGALLRHEVISKRVGYKWTARELRAFGRGGDLGFVPRWDARAVTHRLMNALQRASVL